MIDSSQHIGKYILSSAFGVGKIVSIDQMGTNRDFYVIECEGNNVKTFVPIDDSDSYRFVASKVDIESWLNDIGEETKILEFESKKDRINFFKDNSKIQDTKNMSYLINQLGQLEDRGSTEEQVMNKLIDSFALEYSLITRRSQEECKELVLEKIKGARNG